MGLTKAERAMREAEFERANAQQHRRQERNEFVDKVENEILLNHMKSMGYEGRKDEDGVEGFYWEDVDELPKWLGDIVAPLMGHSDLHERAKEAAEASAEKAYDEAYKAAFETAYAKEFNDYFTLEIASHEGRTYYDERGVQRIKVDGPDAPNVISLDQTRA